MKKLVQVSEEELNKELEGLSPEEKAHRIRTAQLVGESIDNMVNTWFVQAPLPPLVKQCILQNEAYVGELRSTIGCAVADTVSSIIKASELNLTAQLRIKNIGILFEELVKAGMDKATLDKVKESWEKQSLNS